VIQDLRDSVSDFKTLSDQINAWVESVPRRSSRDRSTERPSEADPRSRKSIAEPELSRRSCTAFTGMIISSMSRLAEPRIPRVSLAHLPAPP
jgi:hypothetical protein